VIPTEEAKKGVKILYKGEPCVVMDYQHVKPGKGGAFIRMKIKNLITGMQQDITVRPEAKFEQPDLQYREMLYLYEDDGTYVFMDQEEFDQMELDRNQLEHVLGYLKEQTIYTVLFWSERPISVKPPLHMEFKVTETPPGVKGDTAQGGTKQATLETGLRLQIPLFVEEGDVIRVDTRDGSYVERVSRAG